MPNDVIPLCDLHAQYRRIKHEVAEALERVLKSCAFIKGPEVERFEDRFAAAHGLPGRNAIGCSNGTSALTAALKALDLGEGAEIIMPSHTFFATAESVLLAGCVPVFADIRPGDYTLDPDQVRHLISDRTRAIVPVHIYGAMADMDAFMSIAEEFGLKVVEDAAQAHLATWRGRTAGTIGDAGTFSFYPAKNLGAYGDAGMVVAGDPGLADRVRKLVDHGRASKYLHDIPGDNLRMDAIQAAVLDVKLRHLPEWTRRRRELARLYDEALRDRGFKVIEPPAGSEPVYHLYIVEVSNRDQVIEHMKSRAVSCGIHYPVPVHAQPAIKGLEFTGGTLEVTERIVDRIVSLPLYPELTDDQFSRVCTAFFEVARA